MENLKNTEELLALVAGIGNAVGVSISDGKFDVSDLVNFFGVLTDLQDAIEGAEQVLTELQSAAPEEMAELKADFVAELDLPENYDGIEALVEDHISLGLDLIRLVKAHYLK